MADVKKEVESLLFSSGRAMLVKDLADIIQARPKDVEKAILELKSEYDTRDSSLALMETPDGWKMNVKEKYVSLVTKIVADTELPFPLLETLSVIAYKAPAWQAEVIKVRGTNAYEHIQQLIDAGFVDRQKKGRSFELVLTQKFFDYFDVAGDKNLKMMFQNVKPSEPSPRIKKKLGQLPVVDLPGEQKTLVGGPASSASDGTVGSLEVVNIPAPKKVEPFRPDNDFLDDIDTRIGNLSKRNDEHDQDELLKKPDLEGQPAQVQDSEPNSFEPGENAKMKEIFGEEKSKDVSEDADADKLAAEDSKEKDSDEEGTPKDPLDEEDALKL